MARLAIDVVQTTSGDSLAKARRDVEGLSNSTRDASGRLRDAQGRFLAAGDAAGRLGEQSQKADGGLRGLLGRAKEFAVGFGLAGIVDKAAGAVLQFAGNSIDAASKLQQATGGAQAVFKANYGQIEQLANGAANNLGLAKSEYLDLATVFGAGLKNQGIKDFTGQTEKVIQLGADLAAQYGGSTKDAVSAIGALMRGEADPIERYGVSIKQSAINAELAKQGLSGLTGEARTQAEAQARLKLLYEQTADASGAFAREADTLQGAQARLNARFADVQAQLGGALLPALTATGQAALDTLNGSNALGQGLQQVGGVIVSYVTPIIDGFRGGVATARDILDQATGSSERTSQILQQLGSMASAAASLIGGTLGAQLKALITAAAAVVAGIIQAVDWIGRMKDKAASFSLGPLGTVGSVLDGIASAASRAYDWLSKVISSASSASSAAGGLPRDGAGDPGAGPYRVVPIVPARLALPAPVVNVNLDGRTLRTILRGMVRAELSYAGAGGVR